MSPKLVRPSPRAVEFALRCESESLSQLGSCSGSVVGPLFAIASDRTR